MSFDRKDIPAIITTDLTVKDDDDGGGGLDGRARCEDNTRTPSTATAVSPDDPDRPSTPAIDIQLSHTDGPAEQLHHRAPSDPNFLTPILRTSQAVKTASLEVPGTPSVYSPVSEGSVIYPPSPTLSTRSSVHFQPPTTLALRDNNPDAKSGIDSLQLLRGPGHHRRGSSVSFAESNDGTEPDPHAKRPSSSHSAQRTDGGLSPTITHVEHDLPQTEVVEASGTTSVTSFKNKEKGIKPSSSLPEDRSLQPLDPSMDTSDPTPFEFKASHLASLVDPKNLDTLRKMGGVDQVLKGLGTDPIKGLSMESLSEHREDAGVGSSPYGASLTDRKRVYGINVVPARESKTLLALMWLALKDKILILLSIAAVVSLALGLFQDFGTPPTPVLCEDGSHGCTLPRVDWVEGVAIIIAVIIVDVVGSVNDWQKERQFKKLNEQKEDRQVKVIRTGHEQLVNIKDVVVGDICILEPGEVIPCDGIFLSGHGVRCDESAATGESDAVRKQSYAQSIKERESEDHDGSKSDCFLISGSKVLEGVGQYVIIAVGPKSFNGRIMLALRSDIEQTPLQGKLNHVAEIIAKVGSAAGILLFTALMIRFFVELKTDSDRSASTKAIAFVNNMVISFTIVVVAVPEGLPLAVTLALAFATKRMTKEHLLVRLLASCETMANVSVVCTDKTGTLTQNCMAVVSGSVGIHGKFVRRLQENRSRTNAEDSNVARKRSDDFSVDQSELNRVMSPSLRQLFNESIAINSTAFQDKDPQTNQLVFIGSKTETALLEFAKELNWPSYHETRENADVVEVIPFSSTRKASGVVVRLPDGRFRLYLKGASEILTQKCTQHVVVHDTRDAPVDLEVGPITDIGRENISRTIIFYANQMLRTIAMCFRDIDVLPSNGEFSYDDLAHDLTLIAIMGIEDPLRLGVREAVANCHKAGVAVKMCTGDNVLTARSIASQCGIFTPGGIIMEGPIFRCLNDHDMKEILPRLQVLARSSPEDKQVLVEQLKAMGELVGVTGDGTNDGPALRKANVGFSMGIAGTEVAKEASDIILMDDNFASIVSAIIWGRCVNDAVRKFLQFQISVNITAVIVTFVTAVSAASEQSALTAVQLLWINIIMDTFAALALATDPASLALLDRQPERKSAPLFNTNMAKQILGQAAYQTTVVLVFYFLGHKIWHEGVISDSPLIARRQQLSLQAFIFNAFVFCQIFNSLNCRRLDNRLNVFEGIHRNWYFIAITTGEICIQILIMFFGGVAFSVSPISGLQWGASIVIGLVALPLGALLRCIPNGPLENYARKLRFLKKTSVLPTDNPLSEKNEWQTAMEMVKDNLNTFAKIRGGRLRSSSMVRRSRTSRPQDVTLSSLMTMVPTFVATSVAGRWASGGSLSDPAYADPSRSSAALWEGKIQLHPDTAKDDPAYIRWGAEHSS